MVPADRPEGSSPRSYARRRLDWAVPQKPAWAPPRQYTAAPLPPPTPGRRPGAPRDTGAERAAIVCTVLRCLAATGVKPVEYLADSRRLRLADVPALMPAKWKAARYAAASAGARA